jgi:hypothetical protein
LGRALAPDLGDPAFAARTILAELAARHPGGSLEIRVPPYAAVQANSDGSTHTRGTPPNVIELDAPTLHALARGTLTWPDALATHRATASGIHTNISSWFPL